MRHQKLDIVYKERRHKAGFIFLAYFFNLVFLFFFLLPAAFSRGAGTIDLSSVSIPKEYGLVKEFYQALPSGGKRPNVIFHIQDVHANYEAQKNLANILEYLIETYGLKLILVEGGITDRDFSYIRDWADLEERKEKADKLLREGMINGETYVDIATDFPLKFQGIEDKALYEKNIETYLKIEAFRSDALNFTERIKHIAGRLKKFIYTNRLMKFDEHKNSYKSEKIKLLEYVEYLDDTASKEGLDLCGYPNHAILLKTARLEKEIDFKAVETERDDLINKLTALQPKGNLGGLLAKILKFKNEEISAGNFYSYLSDISVKNNIATDKHKNIDIYVEYITTYEKLDNDGLFREIHDMEDAVSNALCENDRQKTLFGILKNISILEDFLRLKLPPEDLEYYRTHKKDFNVEDWISFLRQQSERFQLEAVMPDDTSIIMGNYGVLESFYGTAFERDEAFMRNSLKKMQNKKERIAVLIAGGFHTKNLTRIFKSNGISYVVLAPKVAKKTDNILYDRILKESYKTRIWNE